MSDTIIPVVDTLENQQQPLEIAVRIGGTQVIWIGLDDFIKVLAGL